ncbi:hypothetical protein PPERSA_10977 [Pseudocohnilembus persalinus]|uniref:NADH:flavin oxidoreductase/NADH oxidase N-terminal domain-containing protein n=1 Tax=Pseudocohnilembus persalinus TaxID=266149 RepID=A0A0V0QCG0_PSEPJ|nr:hypothetical protein PPERSA_10977 [Pseudocohnilembus persalinus]|eukprot:KRW99858.1 hypothetical protein PPERSA_10977 [Pseudocohnilembus persalinus]
MGCSSSSDAKDNQKIEKNSMLSPLQLGPIKLNNRFVMSPMTRCRADPKTNVPTDLMNVLHTDLMVKHYEQRANFGLIITECAPISPLSNAFPGAGGIYTEEQTQGWKKVVDAVHAKGGKIVLQIWHCGRATASEFIGGAVPLAPSPIAIGQDHQMTKKPHPVPKEMTQQDINEVIEQFRKGAENAKKAGFDGVQLHGANGYLVNQFLNDGTNKRSDKYGGSIENRCRFLFEALDAIIGVYGASRTSVRLTPTGRYNDMYESEPVKVLEYLLPELEKRKIQFLEVKKHAATDAKESEAGSGKDAYGQDLPAQQIPGDYFALIRKLYKGKLIANEGFNPQSAQEIVQSGNADLVSFAKLAITNPDLPLRVKNQWEINQNYDFATFFGGGEKGYTDIPTYQEQQQQQQVAAQ